MSIRIVSIFRTVSIVLLCMVESSEVHSLDQVATQYFTSVWHLKLQPKSEKKVGEITFNFYFKKQVLI